MNRTVLCCLLALALAGCRGAPKGGCPSGAVWVDARLTASAACVYTAAQVNRMLDSALAVRDSTPRADGGR